LECIFLPIHFKTCPSCPTSQHASDVTLRWMMIVRQRSRLFRQATNGAIKNGCLCCWNYVFKQVSYTHLFHKCCGHRCFTIRWSETQNTHLTQTSILITVNAPVSISDIHPLDSVPCTKCDYESTDCPTLTNPAIPRIQHGWLDLCAISKQIHVIGLTYLIMTNTTIWTISNHIHVYVQERCYCERDCECYTQFMQASSHKGALPFWSGRSIGIISAQLVRWRELPQTMYKIMISQCACCVRSSSRTSHGTS